MEHITRPQWRCNILRVGEERSNTRLTFFYLKNVAILTRLCHLVHNPTFAVFQMDIPDIGDYQNSEIKGSSMHIVSSVHTRTRDWGQYKMSLATYQHDIIAGLIIIIGVEL